MTVTFNCGVSLTGGEVDIKVLFLTKVIKIDQPCEAGQDCSVTQTVSVPSLTPSSIDLTAIAKDLNGQELACYTGETAIKLEPEEI